MDKFAPGTVCFHKATKLRCVVIKTTEDMVKVRDEINQEQDYYPQELETQEEVEAAFRAMSEEASRANRDRADRYGW